MKRWINAGDIDPATIDNEYKHIMEEIPNFNHKYGSRKVFQRKEYSIYAVHDGFIVHNTNKPFKLGHTHVKSFYKAKSFVDLCIRRKLPNEPREWEIKSLLRISNDNTYKNKLRELI